MVGFYYEGVAESGSVTITAIKSGYNSGTIQVTLSGGLYKLDPSTLSQTQSGQSITSITDSVVVSTLDQSGLLSDHLCRVEWLQGNPIKRHESDFTGSNASSNV